VFHAFGEQDRKVAKIGDVIVFSNHELALVVGVRSPGVQVFEIMQIELRAVGVIDAVRIAPINRKERTHDAIVIKTFGKRFGRRIDYAGRTVD